MHIWRLKLSPEDHLCRSTEVMVRWCELVMWCCCIVMCNTWTYWTTICHCLFTVCTRGCNKTASEHLGQWQGLIPWCPCFQAEPPTWSSDLLRPDQHQQHEQNVSLNHQVHTGLIDPEPALSMVELSRFQLRDVARIEEQRQSWLHVPADTSYKPVEDDGGQRVEPFSFNSNLLLLKTRLKSSFSNSSAFLFPQIRSPVLPVPVHHLHKQSSN